MKKALLVVLLFASNWIFAQGPFELTTKLHKMSEEEFRTLKSNADGGDPRSQFIMGVAYTIGFHRVGVKVDKKEASFWLSKPELKDEPEAAFWLLYPSLQTIEQKKLRPILRDLAERGSLGAMNLYADFAAEGAGGPKDYAEAMKWWRKAAERDSAEGQFNLGLMYLNGEGVTADGKEAVKWFRLAADKGVPWAAARIAPMAMMRQYGLEPTPDVRTWLLTAAEAGDPLSMLNLGMSYYHEIGGPADYVEAYKWFTLALEWDKTKQVIDGRPGLKPKMKQEEISEAEKRAKDWSQRFAPSYMIGSGTPENH